MKKDIAIQTDTDLCLNNEYTTLDDGTLIVLESKKIKARHKKNSESEVESTSLDDEENCLTFLTVITTTFIYLLYF